MDQSTFARTSKNLPLCDLTEPNIVLGKNNSICHMKLLEGLSEMRA